MMNAKGKYSAGKGRHDDRLLARAIADMAWKQGFRKPRTTAEQEKKKMDDKSPYLYEDGKIIINHKALQDRVLKQKEKPNYF